ncbi:MAG: DUF721 domain-containing protein [Nitrospinota bacterium]|jgi:hypothetical protein|nr:DUF721 domain-containing protein [Nitrospinota bacterium]MDP7386377.1 DUF721 domain-containing protein [Nitrospinota bacterium]HJM41757.1 DUF721 domain-containing protein [Nitrospinota bacterium]
MSGFAPVGSILRDVTRSAPWGPGIQRYEVIRNWEEAVGPTVARMTSPVEVKGRTLYVEVRDPVWLQQMVFLSESVRRALNQAVGRDVLDRIFFRQADAPGRPAAAAPGDGVEAEEARERGARMAAQAPDRAESQAALAKIEDPGVREALAQLLARAGRVEP